MRRKVPAVACSGKREISQIVVVVAVLLVYFGVNVDEVMCTVLRVGDSDGGLIFVGDWQERTKYWCATVSPQSTSSAVRKKQSFSCG